MHARSLLAALLCLAGLSAAEASYLPPAWRVSWGTCSLAPVTSDSGLICSIRQDGTVTWSIDPCDPAAITSAVARVPQYEGMIRALARLARLERAQEKPMMKPILKPWECVLCGKCIPGMGPESKPPVPANYPFCGAACRATYDLANGYDPVTHEKEKR